MRNINNIIFDIGVVMNYVVVLGYWNIKALFYYLSIFPVRFAGIFVLCFEMLFLSIRK